MSRKVAEFAPMKIASTDGYTQANVTTFFDGINILSATAYTLPLLLNQDDTVSVQVSQANANSTGTGTITLQGSNYPYDVLNPALFAQTGVTPGASASWSTISFWDEATATWLQSKTVSNTAQSFLFTVPVLGCRAFRVFYNQSANSAAIRMDVQVKSDGGR